MRKLLIAKDLPLAQKAHPFDLAEGELGVFAMDASTFRIGSITSITGPAQCLVVAVGTANGFDSTTLVTPEQKVRQFNLRKLPGKFAIKPVLLAHAEGLGATPDDVFILKVAVRDFGRYGGNEFFNQQFTVKGKFDTQEHLAEALMSEVSKATDTYIVPLSATAAGFEFTAKDANVTIEAALQYVNGNPKCSPCYDTKGCVTLTTPPRVGSGTPEQLKQLERQFSMWTGVAWNYLADMPQSAAKPIVAGQLYDLIWLNVQNRLNYVDNLGISFESWGDNIIAIPKDSQLVNEFEQVLESALGKKVLVITDEV